MLRAYSFIPVNHATLLPVVNISQSRLRHLPTPLAACPNLTRLFQNMLVAQDFVTQDALGREVTRLHQEHSVYNEVNLLAAFQAYLIYSIIISLSLIKASRLDYTKR